MRTFLKRNRKSANSNILMQRSHTEVMFVHKTYTYYKIIIPNNETVTLLISNWLYHRLYHIRLYFLSYRFLNSKKLPLITRQRPSKESVAYVHDNPTFVSDVSKTILHTPLTESSYLKTPESKIHIHIWVLTVLFYIILLYFTFYYLHIILRARILFLKKQ